MLLLEPVPMPQNWRRRADANAYADADAAKRSFYLARWFPTSLRKRGPRVRCNAQCVRK